MTQKESSEEKALKGREREGGKNVTKVRVQEDLKILCYCTPNLQVLVNQMPVCDGVLASFI